MDLKSIKRATALALILLLSIVGFTPVFSQQAGEGGGAGVQDAQAVAPRTGGASGVAEPAVPFKPDYSNSVSEPSAEQMAAFDKMEARRERAYKALDKRLEPNPDHLVAGPNYYIAADGQFKSDETSPNDESLADNSFSVFRSADVFPAGSNRSVINEPAHAQIGKQVFFTGNWYAAKSTNAGATYTYLSPYADFAAFCCDQDVVHDPSRNLMMWYRQGSASAAGVNNIKLSVSVNGGTNFLTYTWAPTSFDASLTNRWFDYPHLAVSNNFLYISTNVFNAADVQTNRIIIRIPLEPLQTGAGFTYYRWTFGAGPTITPVQGATETMYFGSGENSAGTFRVFAWPEATTTLSHIPRTIPAWTGTTRGSAICTVPNGRNPCGRTDQRVTAGWVAKGIIGFFWNVKQGGGFPYPYVNAATFRESDKVYLARPYIWSSSAAWIYGAAAPNIRGHLGIVALAAGGNVGYPRLLVGIDDDFNGAPPGWEVGTIVSSTNWGLSNNGGEGAGDYLRVRQFTPVGSLWTASGYYGTGSPVSYRGRFVAFGRGREQRAWNRWVPF